MSSWLENKSFFVAGAIPMTLWAAPLVTIFNCIISPLLAPVWKMPVVELPEWYSELAVTVILGLLGKKAFDGNTIKLGSFEKPAKEELKTNESRKRRSG